MKIFFHSTITQPQLNTNKQYYQFIESLGHQHTTNFPIEYQPHDMLDPKVRKTAKKLLKSQETAIRKADIVILNANTPSIGTGVYLQIAMHLSKPVIALCENKAQIPFLYEAFDYNKLMIVECTPQNFKTAIPRNLKKAAKLVDKRFTLLLPPEVVEMLDNHYSKTGETRSDYIRNLIKVDQEKRTNTPSAKLLA